jgi:hypothetical protein
MKSKKAKAKKKDFKKEAKVGEVAPTHIQKSRMEKIHLMCCWVKFYFPSFVISLFMCKNF